MLTEPVTCSTCGAVSVNGGTVHCRRNLEVQTRLRFAAEVEANTLREAFAALIDAADFWEACNLGVSGNVPPHENQLMEATQAARVALSLHRERWNPTKN